MGQTTAEVRQDIERTRNEMSDTIDAIADRTRPSRVVGRQRQRLARRFRTMRSQVMGSVQGAARSTQQSAEQAIESAEQAVESVSQAPQRAGEAVRTQTEGNPLAAGLIAFGAGALAAYLIPPSSAERRVASQIRSEAEPALQELKQAGREVAEDVRDTAQRATEDVRSTATESAQRVADQARTASEEVRSSATESAQRVADEARTGYGETHEAQEEVSREDPGAAPYRTESAPHPRPPSDS